MSAEQDLIQRARGGDRTAWLEIVQSVGPQLQGYARAQGIDQAEDLMQDVLLAVAGRLVDFTGDWRAFRSWVFSIAYRRIADAHRVFYRRPAEVPLEAVGATPQGPGPEPLVIDRSQAEASLAALDVLSPVERSVVLLRVLADMDTDEVAAVVGKRPGNVRVIQARAMEKLRRELKGWM